MKLIEAAGHVFEVMQYSMDPGLHLELERRFTEFLWKSRPVLELPHAGRIYVVDRRTARGGIFPIKDNWKPLRIHDGTTEFWAIPEAQVAMASFEDASVPALEGRQIAKPFRWIFGILLDAKGVMLPHAAALTLSGDEAVLLVGSSGSGKSSLAGAWLREEWPVVGDDRVPVWKDGDGDFVVGSLYRSFCLDEAMALRLGVPGATAHRQNGKVVHLLPDKKPLARGAKIRAIVCPHVDKDEGMRLRDLSPGDALRALAPSTLIPSIGVSKGVLVGLTELVQAVPCYELTVGSMLTRTPRLLASLL